jgi:amino acid adenylation domain-containing protein
VPIAELLGALDRLDVRVALEGDRLRVNAPKGVLTDTLRTQLAERKTEIIEFLRGRARPTVDERALIAYWTEHLKGAPPLLALPLDRPRPAIQTFQGAVHVSTIGGELAGSVRALGQRHQATLFMTLLAAFAALLHRYTGQTDIVVGSPVTNRSQLESEGPIGFPANTLVLRTDCSGDPTFRELLGRVRKTTLEAYAHQDVPFERLIAELNVPRDLGHSPLFQVMFILQNAPRRHFELPGVVMDELEFDPGTAKFDLTVDMAEVDGGLLCEVEYSTDLFDASTIQRLLGHFRTLLEGIAADADRRLSELPLLDDAERRWLAEWNDTAAEYPREQTIHGLFAAQVERSPDAIALIDGSRRVSYRELDAHASRLAHHLRGHGAGPGVLVALCLPRSIDAVAGLLAIMKTGAAYVPLDPAYPAARLAFMLRDSGAPVLVTTRRLRERLPAAGVTVIDLETDADAIAREPLEAPASVMAAADLAYVIYTSGSTGTPRGVQAPHQAAVNRFTWMWRRWPFAPGEVCCQKTALSFVDSVWEIFGPLLQGVPSVIVPDEALAEPGQLIDLLAAHGVTRIVLVPSLLRRVLDGVPDLARRAPALGFWITSGETITPDLARRFGAVLPAATLVNLYGSSEVAADVTAYVVTGGRWSDRVPIGRPIANTRLHLLDAHGQVVPIGVAGEIHVGGDAVARGYLHDAELTARKFVPDHLTGRGRLFRTGDRGRLRADGELEYLGRVDDQVKIRGVRIEPGEIESVLREHPSVQAAAVAPSGTAGDERLIGYVVADGAMPDPAELRRFALERLPDHLIPTAFVALDALPLTPSGKVDRRALLAQAPATIDGGRAYVAPRNEVERVLTAVWAEVLGLERVGVGADFFELGGHSLLATQVASRLRQSFGVEVPVRWIFEAPTIPALAERLQTPQHSAAGLLPPLQRAPRGERLPLSFAQQRLWFFEQFEPGSTTFHMSLSLQLDGPLEPVALRRSLEEIWRRHESLRTTFGIADGSPIQRIEPPGEIPLPVTDLRHLEPSASWSELERRAIAESQRPFDLATGPLARAALFRLADDKHVLVITAHHIVADGWSFSVLVRELVALYAAVGQDPPVKLPELSIQYADYAAWQRKLLDGAALEPSLAYWQQTLEHAKELDFPTDRPRAARQTFRGAGVPLMLSPEVSAGLRALARHESATMFMTLLAAFKTVLARHTGLEDIVVGAPVAGRTRPETEALIGVFLNTVALRDDLSGDPTFRDILTRVRSTVLGALANQDVPFDKVVESLRIERDLSRTPLFQVFFNFVDVPKTTTLKDAGLTIGVLPGLQSAALDLPAKFDLSLYAADLPEGTCLFLLYNADLFEASTAEGLMRQLEAVLRAVVKAADTRLSVLPLVSDAERDALAIRPGWPFEQFPSPDRGGAIPDRLRAMTALHADRVAVESERTVWTYRDLDTITGSLAGVVREIIGSRGGRVALLLPHDAPMVAAILGVLRSGNAYVPLDPLYPKERLALMLADSQAGVLITDARNLELARALATDSLHVLNVDELERTEPVTIDPSVSPDSIAYILYTSGSTGRPKGVVQNHRNVLHHIGVYTNNLHIAPDDRLALLASFSFDAAVMDVFGALLNGATLCLFDVRSRGFDALATWLSAQRITIYHSTPTLYRSLLLDLPEAHTFPEVRLVVLGGEEVVPKDVDLYRQHFSANCLLVNGLGPTESTVSFQHFMDRRTALAGRTVPVGFPVQDTDLVLLDPEGRPTTLQGEIGIRSAHVAIGYWCRPELTAAAFLPDPDGGARRIYRTGDLGRLKPDGTLEFVGRRDDQVKVRGFRIEPAEVEAVLDAHPQVRRSVVVAREGEDGDRLLAAYIVPANDHVPALGAIRAHARERLPGYMVPSVFVVLPAFPLTPSGKVDRRALPPPDRTAPGAASAAVGPRTPVETTLAAIWSEALGLESVGIEDSFFDLGGHSLLAVRLFSKIEKVFGVTLPLASLFQAPTIARQAELLEQREQNTPWRALVPIQPAGSHPPLFAIPGLGGIVVAFNDLARLLGPDQPFYALQPRGLDGKLPPFVSIEEMAEHYLTEVRALQPSGPYFLMGVCMGGVVAFEMAQRLRAMGEKVAFLALLDVRPPHPAGRWLPMVRRRVSGAVVRMIASRLAAHGRALLRRPSRRQWREIAATIRRVMTDASSGDPLRGSRGELYHQIVTATNSAAMGRYAPRPYAGSLVLVLAADRKYTRGKDRRMVWRRLAAGGIDICVVPGADSGLTLVEPNVRTLAEQFRTRLDQIRRGVILSLLPLTMDLFATLLTATFGTPGA